MSKYIYLFVGPSGSGKTTVANALSEKYGWKLVDSYTTRKPRYINEKGHIFVDKAEFDALEDKCAYTFFDGNEYCATSTQVNMADIYIIDPAGIEYFAKHYTGHKLPYIIYFDVTPEVAIERMQKRGDNDGKIFQRVNNDKQSFSKKIRANSIIDTNHLTIDEIVGFIKRIDEVSGDV